MLELVEDPNAKKHAQAQMISLVRRVWPHRETRLVAWRPSSAEMRIQHNGNYWLGSQEVGADAGVYRHWNAFGTYSPKGTLHIAVEINIPISENSNRIAGFFARDPRSGMLFLLHDGGVGGGRKGIGRDAFLEAAGAEPLEVSASSGVRMGLIVAPLDSRYFAAGIGSYLDQVVRFKTDVTEGTLPPRPWGLPAGQGYGDYYREFSGLKHGGGERFVYASRHGDVVHALAAWLPKHGFSGTIRKSVLVDLAMRGPGGRMTLFEVKSSTDRQSLYTAIGQLMVHSASMKHVKRYLVVPAGEVPRDIHGCLEMLSIGMVRYRIDGRVVAFDG